VQLGRKHNTGKKGQKLIFFTGIKVSDNMKLGTQEQVE
jgi:hypothetical protein